MGAVLAGHYHIIKPLGSGGFGQTFLATDNHLPGQPVCVVKQLKPCSSTPDSLQISKRLFNLEAETLYRLGNHDQIPRLLAHFEQDGEFYLVQEFIDGQSLSDEFAVRNRLNETEVIALLRDTLQVLAFVHQQNVIHRDIKPSNLMRRRSDRRIILIDFGAVKQVSTQPATDSSGQTNFTIAIGSPGYMPVEQVSSLPRFSSDIYAVGMVCLQALTGIPAKELPKDDRTGEFSYDLLQDRFSINPELAAILDKMVRYDYRQRYENAIEALKALEPLLGGLGAAEGAAIPLNLFLEQWPGSASQSSIETASDQTQTLPPEIGLSYLPALPQTVVHDRLPRRSVTSTRSSGQANRNRQALLNKVKNYWIKGVLEASLHDQVLIALDLEDRFNAIASPWNVALEVANQPAKTLPDGTQLFSIFEQMGSGRTLLILGEPGAGKTTTLLQLTRDLVACAEQDVDYLIPVVLNLSSWLGEKQTIAEWVVAELNSKYQIPKKISQPWVEQQQLLLLLDGLDEVQADRRDACVAALNGFQKEHSTEMIVCSRITDYEALSNRLDFQSAVYLRSLTPEQIYVYLDSLDADLTGLRTLLAEDAALRELARSPLMLNIMVLAYQGVAAEDLLENLVVEERRRQLFNAYIERMLKRRGGGQYSQTQAIAWLSWLAQQLIQQSQTVFVMEQIQPAWLPAADRRQYRIAFVLAGVLLGTVLGIVTGIFTNGLIQGLSHGLIKGLTNSVFFGLVIGCIFGFSKPEVETVETLKWSWKEAKKKLLRGLTTGLAWGFCGGLVWGVMGELIPGLVVALIKSKLLFGVIGGLLAGITGGVSYGLIGGMRGSQIETKTMPNQGIWRSAVSAGISALICGTVGLLTVGLTYIPILKLPYALMYGLSYGLVGGLIAGIVFGGGQACIKHSILRFILYRKGFMPWNYVRFLNYATDRIFLQKVGGGYIFVHRLLMEHFAQIRPPRNFSQAVPRSARR